MTSIDQALGLGKAWEAFEKEVSASITQSGVLQAGLDSLGASLLAAFGGTRAELVRTLAGLIEQGALKVLDLTEFLINLGVVGARGIAALIVPIDAVLFVLGDLGARLVTFETTLLDLATQVPGVGSKFDGLAAQAHAMADATKGWTENTYNQMIAHQELVNGGGKVVEMAHQATEAIRRGEGRDDRPADCRRRVDWQHQGTHRRERRPGAGRRRSGRRALQPDQSPRGHGCLVAQDQEHRPVGVPQGRDDEDAAAARGRRRRR